jgi:hypothetical protein
VPLHVEHQKMQKPFPIYNKELILNLTGGNIENTTNIQQENVAKNTSKILIVLFFN